MEKNKQKLLPCPFCGSMDTDRDSGASYGGVSGDIKIEIHYSECNNCYATGPSLKGFNWNSRAPEMAAQIQSLQQQNAEYAARIEALKYDLEKSKDAFKLATQSMDRRKNRIAELEKQLKVCKEQKSAII